MYTHRIAKKEKTAVAKSAPAPDVKKIALPESGIAQVVVGYPVKKPVDTKTQWMWRKAWHADVN